MSFGNVGASDSLGKTTNCQPNYEEIASRIKKEIDAGEALQTALTNFANVCGIYEFSNISSFAELIGGLILQQRSREIHYNEALTNIESN